VRARDATRKKVTAEQIIGKLREAEVGNARRKPPLPVGRLKQRTPALRDLMPQEEGV
jgi:hypothetical protein